MKIHIIGGSGTGKTYLAEQLSKILCISHYDLDNIHWDNTAEMYGVKMPVEKRDKLLQEILLSNNWIVEGVYYSWCLQCFDEADKIYVLEISRIIYRFRIIKRFLKRKLKMEKGKKETLKSLKDLLQWTDKFQKNNLVEIKKLLEKYTEKVCIIHSSKEVKALLTDFSVYR